MEKTLRFILSLILLAPATASAGTEANPDPPQPIAQHFMGTVGCPIHFIAPDPPANDNFSIPDDLLARAKKKARLINLLRESLRNEATHVNGEKKVSKTDAHVEKEIQKLASEFSK